MNLADTNLLYRRPQLYDELYAGDVGRADLVLAVIHRYAPAATTLLDLGCGTGRDLADLRLRAPYLSTIGIDLQAGMIDHGRRTRPHLDLRTGDLRTLRLGERYDVITCLGNTLAYLFTDPELDAAFATVAAHAHTATLLIVQALIGTPNTGPPRTSTITTTDTTATVTTSTEYDPDTGIATTHRTWSFPDGQHATDHIRRRTLSANELRDRLSRSGFRLWVVADDPANPNPIVSPITYAVATAG